MLVSPQASPPAAPLIEYDDPEDDTLRLNNLPFDALRELYRHVGLPFVLKLVCRALRDAWPEPIVTTLSHVVKTATRFRWAYRVGCPFGWDENLSGNMRTLERRLEATTEDHRRTVGDIQVGFRKRQSSNLKSERRHSNGTTIKW